MENEKIKVLVVEPHKYPYPKEIDSGLASLQHEVGGDIQAVYPFEDEVAIICADEGKILGYDLNRALYDKGEIYDILAGTFLVTDCSGENFAGLSDEMLAKYEKAFHTPQSFVKLNGKIFAVPEKPKPDRSSPSREER